MFSFAVVPETLLAEAPWHMKVHRPAVSFLSLLQAAGDRLLRLCGGRPANSGRLFFCLSGSAAGLASLCWLRYSATAKMSKNRKPCAALVREECFQWRRLSRVLSRIGGETIFDGGGGGCLVRRNPAYHVAPEVPRTRETAGVWSNVKRLTVAQGDAFQVAHINFWRQFLEIKTPNFYLTSAPMKSKASAVRSQLIGAEAADCKLKMCCPSVIPDCLCLQSTIEADQYYMTVKPEIIIKDSFFFLKYPMQTICSSLPKVIR